MSPDLPIWQRPASTASARAPSELEGAWPCATRLNSFGDSSAPTAAQDKTWRIQHTALYAALNVRFLFANIQGLGAGAQGLTIKCALELATGAIIPMFFEGRRSITLDPGGYVLTDPLGLRLDAGQVFYSRTNAQRVGGAGTIPCGASMRGAANGEGQSNGDLVDAGVIANNAAPGVAYSPVAVVTDRPVAGVAEPVAVIGTSIMRGEGDASDTGFADSSRGWPERAFQAAGRGFLNMSRGGSYLSLRLDPARQYLHDFLLSSGPRIVLNDNGTNEFIHGESLATAQANLLTFWRRMVDAGCKVWACTLCPSPSASSDGWTTLGGQTPPAYAADRLTLNNWLRSVPAPLSGCLEVADAVESSRDSGLWKVPGYTADGLHPSPTGHAAIAAALDLSKVK